MSTMGDLETASSFRPNRVGTDHSMQLRYFKSSARKQTFVFRACIKMLRLA